MLKLYRTNVLTVSEITDYSVYLDAGEHGAIPLRDAPDNMAVGQEIEAFVYVDGHNEIVSTAAQANAQVGECAYLRVVSNDDSGTFLDWGLPKDLLLPFSEQLGALYVDEFYVVCVYQDDQQRPVASMKLHRHLEEDSGDLEKGECVDLLIAAESELGFKAVINDEQLGLIHHGELSHPLEVGTRMKGWVGRIREDGKVDLNINALDTKSRDGLEAQILDALKENGGRLDLSDKSSPELIFSHFQVSKKNFKRALGSLYKQRLISISPRHIEVAAPKGAGDDENKGRGSKGPHKGGNRAPSRGPKRHKR